MPDRPATRAPSPARLREELQHIPHPFLPCGIWLRCACRLSMFSRVHDKDSLLDPRAFLNGSLRELAAQDISEEGAGDG